MNDISINRLLGYLLAMLLFFSISCSKDEVIPEEEVVENSRTYIYDIFKDSYFWLEQLPELDPNQYSTNEDLVDALRYDEIDRWGFVIGLDEYKALYEEGETKGFGVGLALTLDDRLMVRFTYAASPMGLAGVDRGWEIIQINDDALADIADLNAAFDTDSEVKFTFLNTAGETVERFMTRTDYKINTVLHWSVIETTEGNVGYLVFESFLEPLEAELDEPFSFFKAENIEDIVVDLRYNGGGNLGVAFYLASLVGGNSIKDKVVASVIYNSTRSDENVSYKIPVSDLAVNINRLFFITTESSASASEFVINSMYPYKEVVLVGEKTHGKPVGMEVFLSEEYNIALAPVTFQVVNAQGNGDYFDGIPVDYDVTDDIFHAWGDPEETCLKQVLDIISGNVSAVATLKSAQRQTKGLPLKRGVQEITGAF